MKIKLFSTRGRSTRDMEEKVNRWIASNPNVVIQNIAVTTGTDTVVNNVTSNIIVMIQYEGEEEVEE